MRFLLLIHGDRDGEAALTPEERHAIVGEHIAYAGMLRQRGAHVAGEALTGETASVRPGASPIVTDGPSPRRKRPSVGSTS